MPMFMSEEWLKAFMDIINSDPNYADATKNWEGDFYMVVLPEGPIKEPIYVYLDAWHSKLRDAYFIKDPASKKPSFTMSAPISVWRRIMGKQLHPVAAIARRLIKVQGNMVKLMQNAKMGQSILECISRTPTEFTLE